MRPIVQASVIAAAVTFAMLTHPRREGGFLPGELVAPEDRPTPALGGRGPDLVGGAAAEAARRPSPSYRRPPTDRDYWRWYGGTHIGDRPVVP